MEDRKNLICPKCKKSNVIPIFYGYPGAITKKKAELGKVKLGSSSVSKNSPKWHCKDCENNWGVYRRFF
jgi:hypothetical protein